MPLPGAVAASSVQPGRASSDRVLRVWGTLRHLLARQPGFVRRGHLSDLDHASLSITRRSADVVYCAEQPVSIRIVHTPAHRHQVFGFTARRGKRVAAARASEAAPAAGRPVASSVGGAAAAGPGLATFGVVLGRVPQTQRGASERDYQSWRKTHPAGRLLIRS